MSASTNGRIPSGAAAAAPVNARLVEVLERVEALLQDLPNQLASLVERDAHVQEMPKAVMSLAEVVDLVGVDQRTLRRWRHEGRFPEPIQGGGRKLLWRRRDVDRWRDEDAP